MLNLIYPICRIDLCLLAMLPFVAIFLLLLKIQGAFTHNALALTPHHGVHGLNHKSHFVRPEDEEEAHHMHHHQPPPPPPKIILVVWDQNGEIMDRPNIRLREIHQRGHIAETHPLVRCRQPPATGQPCHYDYVIGLGVVEITFTDPYRTGKIEISYAETSTGPRVSYIEDFEKLKTATQLLEEHANKQHNKYKGVFQHELTPPPLITHPNNILHLHHHNFRPYTHVYHIHGIVFWRGPEEHYLQNKETTPVVALDPFVFVEYQNEHEQKLHKLPFVRQHNPETGEFRITIRNGYGLDPVKKAEQPGYGNIKISVGVDQATFQKGYKGFHTINVEECIRASQSWEDGSAHDGYNVDNPARILYLWTDKFAQIPSIPTTVDGPQVEVAHKHKFGPFPLRLVAPMLELRITRRTQQMPTAAATANPSENVAALGHSQNGGIGVGGGGAQCEFPFQSSNTEDWLMILDEDDAEPLSFEESQMSVTDDQQQSGSLVLKLPFRKTISDGMKIHIKCERVGDGSQIVYDLPNWNLLSTEKALTLHPMGPAVQNEQALTVSLRSLEQLRVHQDQRSGQQNMQHKVEFSGRAEDMHKLYAGQQQQGTHQQHHQQLNGLPVVGAHDRMTAPYQSELQTAGSDGRWIPTDLHHHIRGTEAHRQHMEAQQQQHGQVGVPPTMAFGGGSGVVEGNGGGNGTMPPASHGIPSMPSNHPVIPWSNERVEELIQKVEHASTTPLSTEENNYMNELVAELKQGQQQYLAAVALMTPEQRSAYAKDLLKANERLKERANHVSHQGGQQHHLHTGGAAGQMGNNGQMDVGHPHPHSNEPVQPSFHVQHDQQEYIMNMSPPSTGTEAAAAGQGPGMPQAALGTQDHIVPPPLFGPHPLNVAANPQIGVC